MVDHAVLLTSGCSASADTECNTEDAGLDTVTASYSLAAHSLVVLGLASVVDTLVVPVDTDPVLVVLG